VAVDPKPPVLRAAQYDEPATFGDVAGIFKFMVENHVRYALTSPPLLKDIKEGTWVWDKTLSRLYTNSNGVLKYIQAT
jgi:hypothetical protein